MRLGKPLVVLHWCRYQKDKLLNWPQELFLCTSSYYLQLGLSYSTVFAFYGFWNSADGPSHFCKLPPLWQELWLPCVDFSFGSSHFVLLCMLWRLPPSYPEFVCEVLDTSPGSLCVDIMWNKVSQNFLLVIGGVRTVLKRSWIWGEVLEKSLNFYVGPWKVLEFSSTSIVVARKVFFDAFGCPRQDGNHSLENLKVIYTKFLVFYAIIN